MMFAVSIVKALLFFISCVFPIPRIHSLPESFTPNWVELPSDDGVKFSGRNAHASCVFNDSIWVVGGRTASYTMWNLEDSVKVADVWRSYEAEDGEKGSLRWVQQTEMTGDYFAQNTDVPQPGSIAPFYQRYGHSLDAVDSNGDGVNDIMIMLGGFASSPMSDQWASEDGVHWLFCGLAPWQPRAWHATTIFAGQLWMAGGTPLNNEVWVLRNITRVSRREPLTRAIYSDYTFDLTWERMPDAPWSPRVGMGLVSQFYFDVRSGESPGDSKERLIVAGGYGGWPNIAKYRDLFDGYISRKDVWESYNGQNWTLLTDNARFGERAWFGMEVLTQRRDQRRAYPARTPSTPPVIYIFGGGFIGFRTDERRRVNTMQGLADGYRSVDGWNWTKINYEEGGGTTAVPFFSSQEWSETVVDTSTEYLGRWGLTLHTFDTAGVTIKKARHLVLIAGDFTGGGEFADSVYASANGIFCDTGGITCFNRGKCDLSEGGCVCDIGFTGAFCELSDPDALSAAPCGRRGMLRAAWATAAAFSILLSTLLGMSQLS